MTGTVNWFRKMTSHDINFGAKTKRTKKFELYNSNTMPSGTQEEFSESEEEYDSEATESTNTRKRKKTDVTERSSRQLSMLRQRAHVPPDQRMNLADMSSEEAEAVETYVADKIADSNLRRRYEQEQAADRNQKIYEEVCSFNRRRLAGEIDEPGKFYSRRKSLTCCRVGQLLNAGRTQRRS